MAWFSLERAHMPVAGAVQSQGRLDRYQLVEKIGRGGMAEVHRARLTSIGGFAREVAVKVLLPEYAREREFVDMLLDEARIAGAVVHPCVVQVLDVGQAGDTVYLVMEHVRGTDLRTLARTVVGGKLPLAMALYVMRELLRGLDAVHRAGIVHRDVSPANVLIDDAGAVKLADFGIAHAAGRLTETRAGLVKGKSRYMAPEQLGGRPVDHRVDVYAAGVTLFEAILGDVARESSHTTPYGPIFTWPARLPRELVPDDVAALLRRALADDPQFRFASAAAFGRALGEALAAHAPGYDGAALARTLRQLRGEPVDDEDDGDGDDEDLLSSNDAATALRDPCVPPPARPKLALVESGPHGLVARTYTAPAEPFPSPPTVSNVYGERDGGLYASVDRPTTPFRGLPALAAMPRRHPVALLLGSVVVAAVIAAVITFANAVGEPALPLPSHPRPAPPRVTPLVHATPAMGTLAVGGPAGARVWVGEREVATAPCAVELEPGAYEVKVRTRRGQRARTVSIEAGATTVF